MVPAASSQRKGCRILFTWRLCSQAVLTFRRTLLHLVCFVCWPEAPDPFQRFDHSHRPNLLQILLESDPFLLLLLLHRLPSLLLLCNHTLPERRSWRERTLVCDHPDKPSNRGTIYSPFTRVQPQTKPTLPRYETIQPFTPDNSLILNNATDVPS